MNFNFYDDMKTALEQHRGLQRAVRQNANALADLLEENLRFVSPYKLERIKKQLRDFNAHTGRWKS